MRIILRNKMPIIRILNREYQIACGPGEEEKLLALAEKLDKRLQENSRSFRGANEMMVIILTALTLEDSVQDLSQQNILLQKKLAKDVKCDDEDSNHIIDGLVERIEAISKQIKNC